MKIVFQKPKKMLPNGNRNLIVTNVMLPASPEQLNRLYWHHHSKRPRLFSNEFDRITGNIFN